MLPIQNWETEVCHLNRRHAMLPQTPSQRSYPCFGICQSATHESSYHLIVAFLVSHERTIFWILDSGAITTNEWTKCYWLLFPANVFSHCIYNKLKQVAYMSILRTIRIHFAMQCILRISVCRFVNFHLLVCHLKSIWLGLLKFAKCVIWKFG